MSSRCFRLNRVYSISFNSTNFGEFFQRNLSKFRKRKSLSWALSINQEIPEILVGIFNETHVFRAFHWKVPGNKCNFGKVALFSLWKFPVKCMFHLRIIISYRLFKAISVPPSWILGWWRKHKRIELESDGTRYSFYRPFHGNFRKVLVNMEIVPSTNVLHQNVVVVVQRRQRRAQKSTC